MMRISRLIAALTIVAGIGCGQADQRVPTRVVIAGLDAANDDVPAAGTSATTSDVAETVTDAAPAATPDDEGPVETDATDDGLPADDLPAEETPHLPRLHGRVSVEGEPPSFPAIPVGNCGLPIPDERVVVGPEGGLANCIVYLRSYPEGTEIPPPPDEPLIVDQKGCRFVPHVSFGRVSQMIVYRNSDRDPHNVRALPFRNTGFSITTGAGLALEHQYSLPEARPMMVKCDIHTWMTAYHAILDHPWCAITDETGRFEISGLPEGELEFVAWHETKGYIVRSFTLEIAADSDVERNYQIDADELAE